MALTSDTVRQTLETLATAAGHATAAFVPEGVFLTHILIAVAIVWFAVGWWHGNDHAIGGGLRMALCGAGTLWLIGYWPSLATLVLAAAEKAIGMVTGGFQTPADLFDMAIIAAERVWAEGAGAGGWGPSMWWQAIITGLSGIVILAALGLPAILAYVAEVQLLIGATVSPIVLPMLAVPATAAIGWAPVRFLIFSGLRVVVIGVTCYVLALTVVMRVTLPGADQTLTGVQLGALALVAVTALVVGIGLSGVARDLLSGAIGTMGYSSVTRAYGTAAAGGRMVGRTAAGGAALAAGGAQLAKGAAGLAAGAVAGGAAMVRRMSGKGGGSSDGGGGVASSPGTGEGGVGKSAFE
jgi:hypothetical protein